MPERRPGVDARRAVVVGPLHLEPAKRVEVAAGALLGRRVRQRLGVGDRVGGRPAGVQDLRERRPVRVDAGERRPHRVAHDLLGEHRRAHVGGDLEPHLAVVVVQLEVAEQQPVVGARDRLGDVGTLLGRHAQREDAVAEHEPHREGVEDELHVAVARIEAHDAPAVAVGVPPPLRVEEGDELLEQDVGIAGHEAGSAGDDRKMGEGGDSGRGVHGAAAGWPLGGRGRCPARWPAVAPRAAQPGFRRRSGGAPLPTTLRRVMVVAVAWSRLPLTARRDRGLVLPSPSQSPASRGRAPAPADSASRRKSSGRASALSPRPRDPAVVRVPHAPCPCTAASALPRPLRHARRSASVDDGAAAVAHSSGAAPRVGAAPGSIGRREAT